MDGRHQTGENSSETLLAGYPKLVYPENRVQPPASAPTLLGRAAEGQRMGVLESRRSQRRTSMYTSR